MTFKRSLFGAAGALLLATATFGMSPAFADGDMSEGTIKKIDASAGKVTIKHGPLDNLEMPPMTMIFNVGDLTMLDSFKNGDEIKFVAVDENGKLVVKEMKPAS